MVDDQKLRIQSLEEKDVRLQLAQLQVMGQGRRGEFSITCKCGEQHAFHPVAVGSAASSACPGSQMSSTEWHDLDSSSMLHNGGSDDFAGAAEEKAVA